MLKNIRVNLICGNEDEQLLKSMLSNKQLKDYEIWYKELICSINKLEEEYGFNNIALPSIHGWIKGRFYYDSSFILEYVMQRLENIDCGECRQINLEFSKDEEKNSKVISSDGGFYNYYCTFNYDNYFKKSNSERTLIMYDLLQNSLKECFDFMNWDYSQLDKAFKSLEEDNFETEYYIKKKVCNSKKIGAQIYCEHYIDKIRFYIEFTKKNQLINRKFFLETQPSRMDYSRYLGKLAWENDQKVVLYSRYDDDKIEINFEEN